MIKVHCYICNALVPDIDGPTSDHLYIPQSPGCWQLYTDVLAREFGEWNYPPIHKLTADCYAAQHPAQTPNEKSAQSINIHLLGIYLALEKKLNATQINKIVSIVIKNNKDKFLWLEPPKNLGSITVADVWEAKSLPEHTELVKQWARSLWNAWDAYHTVIKQLVE